MVVSFSRNIFLKLYCRIENKIINIDGERWRNGRHKCRCHARGGSSGASIYSYEEQNKVKNEAIRKWNERM